MNVYPISQDTINAAISENWFSDSEGNRLQGYGKGINGESKFQGDLLNQIKLHRGTQNIFKLFEVREDGPTSPAVGWAHVAFQEDRRKTAAVYVFIAPHRRREGFGTKAMIELLEGLFSNGIYRVESEVLRINGGAIEFLKSLGFTQESLKKATIWMDRNVYDTLLFRLLRRHYEQE